MKIALVSVRAVDPCFPISLLSLQAYLKSKHPQHQVDIVDAAFENPLKRIVDGRYDLVGIGAMTADYETATQLAKDIKSFREIPVILGGIHISKLPQSFRPCFEVGVMGEGEEPLCRLVSLYEKTRRLAPEDLGAIDGLVFFDREQLRQTPARPLPLENYPHLDYDSVHPAYFARQASPSFGQFGVESFLMTSRGCPFRCTFCASSHFWKGVRYFPVDWVMEEIRILAARGVELINFGDDLFACNKKRLAKIASQIRSENLHEKVTFGCSANPGVFDEQICELLQSINVKPIFFGFESGDEQILKYLKNGKTSVAENRRAVELCKQYGFYCWGGLIIGSPGETLEQMEHTIEFIDWAKRQGAVRLCVAILHPFPGTPVWDTALEQGKVGVEMNFDRLHLYSKEATEGMLVADHLKPDFIRMRDRAYRRIHSFKWTKARMLLRNSPWDTLKFALAAPQSVLARLFSPTTP